VVADRAQPGAVERPHQPRCGWAATAYSLTRTSPSAGRRRRRPRRSRARAGAGAPRAGGRAARGRPRAGTPRWLRCRDGRTWRPDSCSRAAQRSAATRRPSTGGARIRRRAGWGGSACSPARSGRGPRRRGTRAGGRRGSSSGRGDRGAGPQHDPAAVRARHGVGGEHRARERQDADGATRRRSKRVTVPEQLSGAGPQPAASLVQRGPVLTVIHTFPRRSARGFPTVVPARCAPSRGRRAVGRRAGRTARASSGARTRRRTTAR
jgi:hypothetical protein